MTEPRETLKLIASRVDLQVTMHDLRRTFATILNRMNIQNYTMKRLLNHLYDPSRDTDVTSGYVQVDINELRTVIQALENAVIQRPNPR
jgi:site-specific recombinase XerD